MPRLQRLTDFIARLLGKEWDVRALDHQRSGRPSSPVSGQPGDRLWLDDGPALFQVRRTRAGDAWERRQAEACATPEPDTAPVSLGLPTLRVGAPA